MIRVAAVPNNDVKCVASETAESKEDWISEDVLQSLFAEEVIETSAACSDDQFRSLWDEPSADTNSQGSESLWQFDITDNAHGELTDPNSEHSSLETGQDSVDYTLLEQSLASLKFCEDLPDASEGSRLMPLFRENPFSHMILNSKVAVEESSQTAAPFLDSCCKHCQEAYEVVLDMESSPRDKTYDYPILKQVDSRLNFDWCNYHPPLWPLDDECESDKSGSMCSRYPCDCEFCRSRIWSRTCRTCGTPL